MTITTKILLVNKEELINNFSVFVSIVLGVKWST
jgi:hypothetical protein